jgi:hypothetical protein
MSEEPASAKGSDRPGRCEIRLKGHLDGRWADWFGGLEITLEDNGNMLLSGPLADQAALHGLLRKVRDLGVPLLSVNWFEPSQTEASDSKPSSSTRRDSSRKEKRR